MDILERMKRGLSTILSALICVAIGLAIGYIILFFMALFTQTPQGTNNSVAEAFRIAYEDGFMKMIYGCFVTFKSSFIPIKNTGNSRHHGYELICNSQSRGCESTLPVSHAHMRQFIICSSIGRIAAELGDDSRCIVRPEKIHQNV